MVVPVKTRPQVLVHDRKHQFVRNYQNDNRSRRIPKMGCHHISQFLIAVDERSYNIASQVARLQLGNDGCLAALPTYPGNPTHRVPCVSLPMPCLGATFAKQLRRHGTGHSPDRLFRVYLVEDLGIACLKVTTSIRWKQRLCCQSVCVSEAKVFVIISYPQKLALEFSEI